MAREHKPELLDAMPCADGTERMKPTEESDITTTITAPIITVTNGEKRGSLSDENSSEPISELEEKSNDSSFKNGNGNLNGEDSKDFGSECIESEDSRIIPSEENSIDDNVVDSSVEPAFKKQRVESTELAAVVVGEDAQL